MIQETSGPCVFVIKPVIHEHILMGKFQGPLSPPSPPRPGPFSSSNHSVFITVKSLLQVCFCPRALSAVENHRGLWRVFSPSINGPTLNVQLCMLSFHGRVLRAMHASPGRSSTGHKSATRDTALGAGLAGIRLSALRCSFFFL